MPDQIKISELPDGGVLDGTELLPMVQSGTTVKEPLVSVNTYIQSLSQSVGGTPAGGTSNLAARDSGGNSAFNNVILNVDFRNALGFDIVLTKASGYIQEFNSGSVNTNILMPNATTLVALWPFLIINNSTAIVSVKTSVGGAICTLARGEQVLIRALTVSTAGGSWEFIPFVNVQTALANQVLLAKNAFGQNVWSSNTLTMAGNLNFANDFNTVGNFAVTQTYTGITNVTFPTSGTLITSAQVPTNLTQGSVVFIGASSVYAQDNSNFFWDGTNHQLGVGTNSLASTDLATLSTTKANNLLVSGTKTSVDGSLNQSAVQITSVFNPTSSSIASSGVVFNGSFVAPLGQSIAQAAGVVISPKFNATVGSIGAAVGVYYDGGTSASGTLTNNYGAYFTVPVAGTVKIATYSDNLVVGPSNATTNPPTRGALIEGNIINNALSAFQLVGTDTNKTLTSMGNGASGTLLKSNGASALPTYTTATYPSTTTANQLLYSSATNTVAGLATANSGMLITDGSGVPSISSRVSVSDTGGWQKIQSTNIVNGDASVTFTNTALYLNYTTLKIVFSNFAANTNAVFLLLQISSSGGASYITSGYVSGIHTLPYNSTTISNTTNTTGMIVGGAFTNVSTDIALGEILLTGLITATEMNSKTTLLNGGVPFNIQGCGYFNGSIDGFRLIYTSGTMKSGNATLYGLR